MNPDTESDKQYLNTADTPCTLLSEGSFIPPADQVKDKSSQIAIEQNEEELHNNTKEIIHFLDNKTDNWLHDSIIKSISSQDVLSIKVIHSREEKSVESDLSFYNADISLECSINEIFDKEIYFLRIFSPENEKSKLTIHLTDNSTIEIAFEDLKIK